MYLLLVPQESKFDYLAEAQVSLRGPSPIPDTDPCIARFGLLLVPGDPVVAVPDHSVNSCIPLD
jgi:hypothetical protein